MRRLVTAESRGIKYYVLNFVEAGEVCLSYHVGVVKDRSTVMIEAGC